MPKLPPRETEVLVHPAPGVKLYTPGRHGVFEPGRPVPLPLSHARAHHAEGLVHPHSAADADAMGVPFQPLAGAAPATEPAEPAAAEAPPLAGPPA